MHMCVSVVELALRYWDEYVTLMTQHLCELGRGDAKQRPRTALIRFQASGWRGRPLPAGTSGLVPGRDVSCYFDLGSPTTSGGTPARAENKVATGSCTALHACGFQLGERMKLQVATGELHAAFLPEE